MANKKKTSTSIEDALLEGVPLKKIAAMDHVVS